MGFGGGLQGSLTGRQNTKFVCRIHGQGHLIPVKIDYVQEFAEIGDAFDEPVKTYSSGMKARLQFALSLAFDFDVYISDEITAVGDAEFKKKAQKAFADLRSEEHTSELQSLMRISYAVFCLKKKHMKKQDIISKHNYHMS